jgi:KDO2-lipid IV(A) lauroyltransferase
MSNKPLRKRLKNWLIYQFIRGLIWIVRHMPRSFALWFFRQLGVWAFYLIRDAREKTIRHLRLAFGDQRRDEEIRRLAKQVFRQLGLNAAEAMRMPNLIKAGLHKHIRFVGKENLDLAYRRGKGVVCLTGHIGCWELFGAFIASHYPLKVVGAALYDPRLDAIFWRADRAGYSSLPRDASGTRQILRWLKQGGLLAFSSTKIRAWMASLSTSSGPAYTCRSGGDCRANRCAAGADGNLYERRWHAHR